MIVSTFTGSCVVADVVLAGAAAAVAKERAANERHASFEGSADTNRTFDCLLVWAVQRRAEERAATGSRLKRPKIALCMSNNPRTRKHTCSGLQRRNWEIFAAGQQLRVSSRVLFPSKKCGHGKRSLLSLPGV